MTSLANNYPCKNPSSKTLLGVNFLFVNRFSKFLRHILGLKECYIVIRYSYEGVSQRGDTEKPPSKRCLIRSRAKVALA